MLMLLMMQLQNFAQLALVFLTAPLGLIGAVARAAASPTRRSASSPCWA